jgi:23S rRNA (adenine2503-C2)-methyltransferase
MVRRVNGAADIRSLLPAEIGEWLGARKEPRFRAEQIFRWLHGEAAVESPEAMSNVPRELRAALVAELPQAPLALDAEQVAADGTHKLRFVTHDGRRIESVLIPEEHHRDEDGAEGAARERLTLCVSSQVGCALDCAFCATATLGFGRNLSAGEIVQQIYRAAACAGRRPTNLVFMGMGEPLHNFDNLSRALALLTHRWGAGFSPAGSRSPPPAWCRESSG